MEPKDIIARMPDMFIAAKAKRYNRVIGLSITGSSGGDWWLEIQDQKLTVHEGPREDAKVRVTMQDGDFVDVFTGRNKAMNLVTSKRMSFSGPMTEGIAFMSIWDIPKPQA